MEVSNEIKEEIRKTQLELKNAIRIHQVWIMRLREDEENVHIKCKVNEAEKEIVAIGQAQKLVVQRLRRELELYQQRLKARNKPVNVENDNSYVAQQLRDYQLQHRNKNKSISLLKPSVLNEIHIKVENCEQSKEINASDSDSDIKSFNEKDNSNQSESDGDKYGRTYNQISNTVNESRNNFTNVLNKIKESFVDTNKNTNEWLDQQQQSDSETSLAPLSPSPSPPLLPEPGEPVTQEIFLRLLGLVTPAQKEILQKKRNERRKRAPNSTNRNDFVYGNYEMMPKRKKLNNYPYLQSHNEPPQTRSAKLRKQVLKTSREGSPSGSSTENKSWNNSKPTWAVVLPASVSVETIVPSVKKVCNCCGRTDVPSLLAWCASCAVWQHTGCYSRGAAGAPRCAACLAPLHEQAGPAPAHSPPRHYLEKLNERKQLQEKNIQLCIELRKLEARASSLKENLDEHNAEKRQLLSDQIETQRNLQKLLDFISLFKETSISERSTSISDSASELSKSNEE